MRWNRIGSRVEKNTREGRYCSPRGTSKSKETVLEIEDTDTYWSANDVRGPDCCFFTGGDPAQPRVTEASGQRKFSGGVTVSAAELDCIFVDVESKILNPRQEYDSVSESGASSRRGGLAPLRRTGCVSLNMCMGLKIRHAAQHECMHKHPVSVTAQLQRMQRTGNLHRRQDCTSTSVLCENRRRNVLRRPQYQSPWRPLTNKTYAIMIAFQRRIRRSRHLVSTSTCPAYQK